MIFEPSKYDLSNIRPVLPNGVKTPPTMPKFVARMGLESVNNVRQGVDTPQTQHGASNSPKTAEQKPNTPKLALEVPSIHLGGGISTSPIKFEMAPIQQELPFN